VRELKQPVTAVAHALGAEDQVNQRLVGACGYTFGLSCRPGLSKFDDPPLALPRVEVTGSDDIRQFASKVNPGQGLLAT
jgi:hypothetical protein